MAKISHDLMPAIRAEARNHPGLWVMDDGSVQLRPGMSNEKEWGSPEP